MSEGIWPDVYQGDCRAVLQTLEAESVHCCVTSSPYWGLRSYGTEPQVWGGEPLCEHDWTSERYYREGGGSGRSTDAFHEPGEANAARLKATRWRETTLCAACGAWKGELGLEDTPERFVAHLVEVFRAVWRVLRPEATLWLNLGDCFNAYNGNRGTASQYAGNREEREPAFPPGHGLMVKTLKQKDLIGVPWMVAFGLRADGWYLRQAITWCLSGGTRVYARTQKGEMPMAIKDLVRLRPETVQLWNGTKWTQVLGWSETPRPATTYELELRSGERIGCTGNHLWPTTRGNVRADELKVGDVIRTCRLPEAAEPARPTAMDDGLIGWFVGLYIAEGSRYDGTISIAGHAKEEDRLARLRAIAAAYHGYCSVQSDSENSRTIRLNGPMLNGIIDTYVAGERATGKHLNPRAWQRSDAFLTAVLEGYLSGDGHYDALNQRWRLGYCQNDAWTADLRTICGRLGISLRVRRRLHCLGGRKLPGYRGEIRFGRSGHWANKQDGEIVAIRQSRARKFWDIGVEDEPHLFALASGVLTHNCKPAPMPESVTDRCTSATEMLFMFAKQERYSYDAAAIAEPCVSDHPSGNGYKRAARLSFADEAGARGSEEPWLPGGTRNRRNWWVVNTATAKDAHFAVMPEELAAPCILAGCPVGGTVLDPFAGSGTTGRVATRLGRRSILIDLNPEYLDITRKRTAQGGLGL